MSQRQVRVAREVDNLLVGCQKACQEGRMGPASYRRLTAWLAAILAELATDFDQFGEVSNSLSDFFTGRVTRTRTDQVDAATELLVTAVLDRRTEVVTLTTMTTVSPRSS